jgi:hypothetical protein
MRSAPVIGLPWSAESVRFASAPDAGKELRFVAEAPFLAEAGSPVVDALGFNDPPLPEESRLVAISEASEG